ncbi:MAG: Ig-like domain-containing protein, partial [Clostridiales Family XIII bacterium]|nr:Ig-like domain-containing protein [Clostridiales Family XIII bacterium]
MKLKMRYFGTVMLVAISVVCATGSGFAQIGVPCGADSEMTGPRFSAGATASLNILRENETDSAAEQEEPSAPPAPVELVIDQAPNSLKIGEEAPIFYTLRNASADAVIEWRSSNETVAVVDSEGKVRAISPGNVEITAAIGEAKSSALITVTEIAAESV